MLITIGLFLAVVLLLLIGYIGEVLTSLGEQSEVTEEETAFETEHTLSPAA